MATTTSFDGLVDSTTDNATNMSMDGTTMSSIVQARARIFSEDLIMAYNMYLYIIIALGVPGNLLVLVVYIKNRPSTTTDWFVIFISVFDFITAAVNVPVYVTFTNGVWRLYGNTLMCRLHMIVSQSIVLSSSFLICGLAMDRYFKVCRPNSTAVTKARARNYCCIISVVTTILSMPAYVMYEDINNRCSATTMDAIIFGYYLMVLLSFITATITVIVAYIQVSKAILHSERNVMRNQAAGLSRAKPIDGEPAQQVTYKNWWCCRSVFVSNKIMPTSTVVERSRNVDTAGTSGVSFNTISADRSYDNTMPKLEDTRGKGMWAWVSKRIQTTSVPDPPTAHSSGHMTTMTETGTMNAEQQRKKPTIPEQRRMTVSLRTTKVAFLVCSIFVVTWIPPWVCFILATSPTLRAQPSVLRFMMFGRMTHLLNTVTNPIVYTGLNTKFRKHAKELLMCKLYR